MKKSRQNLRANFQNDLEIEGRCMTNICSRIGNRELVAIKHYLRVTDDEFTKKVDDEMVIVINSSGYC